MIHNAIQSLVPNAICRVEGETIYWEDQRPQPSAEAIQAEIDRLVSEAPTKEAWNAIKAERDRRQGAGVKIGAYWFHTDEKSRIQQIGLKLFGVSVPPVPWKTMSGEFVPMTQALAESIFQAVAALDMALFAKAEQHKAAMLASPDPAAYDFSTGWPLSYGE